MVRIIFPFRARVDYRHVEPVNNVTVKGLQPLWNEGTVAREQTLIVWLFPTIPIRE